MKYIRTKKQKVLFAVGIICFIAALFHRTIRPSNDRVWSDDQRTLSSATIRDTEVTLHNVRNFAYTSTTSFTPSYYDKKVRLDELISLDYIVEPFGNIGAAHTFLSFGFSDGSHIAISVEIRKEIGEAFSPWRGLLRQYELMYVIADERDVVKLRTNYRKDIVYLYPTTAKPEHIRSLFIDMLTRANTLREKPEFYNTITNNCTTNIAAHINTIVPNKVSWDYRLLFPENSDVLAQKLGLIAEGMTIKTARKRYQINEKAERFADDPDFSKRIRE